MCTILHDGVVEGFLAAPPAAMGQGLVPLGLPLASEDPAAVILALEYEEAFGAEHQHIDLGGPVLALGDVEVEEEACALLLIAAQVAVCCHVFAPNRPRSRRIRK